MNILRTFKESAFSDSSSKLRNSKCSSSSNRMLHLRAPRFSHPRPRVPMSLHLSLQLLRKDRRLHSLSSLKSSNSPQPSHPNSQLPESRLNRLRLRRLQMEVTWRETASRISSQLKRLPILRQRRRPEQRTSLARAVIY